MSFARSGALLVLLIGSAMAKPAGAQEQSLEVDDSASSARIFVNLRIRTRPEGVLSRVSGKLRGSVAQGWQVSVKVDGRTLRFDGARWMERITRSDSFLAVDRFPVIRFDSGSFSDQVLREGGEVHGELTLRGLTQAVRFRLLPSACARIGRDCDIQVLGTISRRAFGMNAHRALAGDDVDLQMRVRLLHDIVAP